MEHAEHEKKPVQIRLVCKNEKRERDGVRFYTSFEESVLLMPE